MIRIGRFPVQTTLASQAGIGTHPRYEVPGDLRLKIVKIGFINIGLVRLFPSEWPKVDRGAAK